MDDQPLQVERHAIYVEGDRQSILFEIRGLIAGRFGIVMGEIDGLVNGQLSGTVLRPVDEESLTVGAEGPEDLHQLVLEHDHFAREYAVGRGVSHKELIEARVSQRRGWVEARQPPKLLHQDLALVILQHRAVLEHRMDH